MKFAFLMITFVLYIFTPHIEGIKSNEDTEELINRICVENEDYGFCYRIIHENLKKPTATLEELAYLILHTAYNHAHDTDGFITDILQQWPDPKETTGLKTCLSVYDTETTIFKEIDRRFSKRDYKCIIVAIMPAAKILENCRTNFVVPPYKENPLTEKNRVMRILITMSAVSVHMVQYGKASLLSSVVSTAQFFNS